MILSPGTLRVRGLAAVAAAAALAFTVSTAPAASAAGLTTATARVVAGLATAPTFSLSSVSCARASNCLAVGDHMTSSGSDLNVAEEWRANRWRSLSVPSPGSLDGLSGVACPQRTNCLAVGAYLGTSGLVDTLAEAWNGTRWRMLSTPSPGVTGSLLSGVACARPARCVAVGNYGAGANDFRTLAEAWNGMRWRVLKVPHPGTDSGLTGVSCIRPDRCVAVGHYQRAGGVPQTLAEGWNGSRWRLLAAPSPGTRFSDLAGIACARPDRCIAVGNYQNVGGMPRALAEEWNGTRWRVMRVRTPSGARSGISLSGVSCPTAARCFAVGAYGSSSGQGLTLAQEWNGSSWRLLKPVNPANNEGSSLVSVACPRTASCVAVGSFLSKSGDVRTLAEAWNGTAWRLMKPTSR